MRKKDFAPMLRRIKDFAAATARVSMMATHRI